MSDMWATHMSDMGKNLMETKIIDGKKIQDEILQKVRAEVQDLSFQPVFCDVLVGDDPASVQYVELKGKMAEAVGIAFHRANLPKEISTEQLVAEIENLNKVPNMCGIIIQLPLPPHIDRQAALNAIDPKLDVDCLGKEASENFYHNKGGLGYPTALACMAVLDQMNLDLGNPSLGETSKKIAVLGQGLLVGRPVIALLRFQGFHPETVSSQTENKEEIIKNADVIISGMGQGKYITGNMIKEGAAIIDAGTSEVDGGLVGDVDMHSLLGVAGFISPVPGGVGPVTVAMLLKNVLTVAKDSR